MSIYKVIISFMHENLHFNQERGVRAMTPGQALDDVMKHLNIDTTRIHELKTFVERAESLDSFNYSTQNMVCINSSQTVKDLWNRRYGE